MTKCSGGQEQFESCWTLFYRIRAENHHNETVRLRYTIYCRTGGQARFYASGGGAMHLVDSLGRCKDLEYICNLHEQACAIAAEAYARVTNNLGVAIVTTGPGGTNAITGVAGAWLDSTPCLFISGQVKRADMTGESGVRQLGVQEIDIVSLVKPITKYAVTITDPLTIRYHLEKAVYMAKSGRPAPSGLTYRLMFKLPPLIRIALLDLIQIISNRILMRVL